MNTSLRRTALLSVVACSLVVAIPASAQESAPAPVVPDISEPPAPQLSYDEYKLEEMRRRTRVSRNAFIGTSVAAALGAALFLPGVISQCDKVRRFDGTNELVCSTAGALLVGFGTPLVFGGGVGMVATGIMLGVRKGKVRKLKARAGPSARRVRWDPATARFVF